LELDDEGLARGSTYVVVAEVDGVERAEYPIAPSVFTEVSLRIERHLLPGTDEPGSLLLRIPGGGSVIVPGMPSFEVGERVVVFLEPQPTRAFGDAPQSYLPVGLNQGVWRIGGEDLWERGDQHGLFGGVEPVVRSALSLGDIEILVESVR
jgi:hypothetical protein